MSYIRLESSQAVERLLLAGSDATAVNDQGFMALNLASFFAVFCHVNVVRILVAGQLDSQCTPICSMHVFSVSEWAPRDGEAADGGMRIDSAPQYVRKWSPRKGHLDRGCQVSRHRAVAAHLARLADGLLLALQALPFRGSVTALELTAHKGHAEVFEVLIAAASEQGGGAA